LLDCYDFFNKKYNYNQTIQPSNNPKTTMKQTNYPPLIEGVLNDYVPISLVEMDRVSLLDRQDTKVVLPIEKLPGIIERLSPYYRVLETDGGKINQYHSLYYDTEDWESYREHHNQRKNRYKIRYRSYVDSDLNFFEIKHKTNKNRTVKTRIKTDAIKTQLGLPESNLLIDNTPLNPFEFKPVIWVNYKRITLVSNDYTERVTIDFDIEFERYNTRNTPIGSPGLAIIEIKQERFNRKSVALRTLHQERIFPIRVSKYCLGVMSCYNGEIKRNGFKNKLLRIAKITNNDFYRSLAEC